LNKYWNSFLISANIPRDPKGDIPLSAKESTLHNSEARNEDVTERRKRKEIEDSSFSQPTSQKRSKSRLTNKTEEIQAPVNRAPNPLPRDFPYTIQLELVECAYKGIDERQVELGEENANTQEMKQQLKQVQDVIAQCYQENRELRRQLAEKIIETPAPQSQAGQLSPTSPTARETNINWLKKQLIEVQDVIIELREEKRISEGRIMEHFKECKPAIDNACASLSDAQLKLKINGALLRQMKNLKRQILSLRRTNRALQLQVTLNKEASDKLDDPILCSQLDSRAQPLHEDPPRKITAQISQPAVAQQEPESIAQQ
jgi:hypothetical protein